MIEAEQERAVTAWHLNSPRCVSTSPHSPAPVLVVQAVNDALQPGGGATSDEDSLPDGGEDATMFAGQYSGGSSGGGFSSGNDLHDDGDGPGVRGVRGVRGGRSSTEDFEDSKHNCKHKA